MTGYEEELVETRSTNTAALCNELLVRCLSPVGERSEEANSRVETLLVAERDAAIVDLRRLTFGDRVETDVECPGCGAASHVSFDLTQVTLEAADVAEGLEVTLSDGRLAELRLPTARDQVDLLAAALSGAAERRSWLLERAIQRLGDTEGPLGFEKVHALDSRTRLELERELEQEIPDLDLRVGATCEACGREFAAPFDVASFFLPS
jgi:phage FluMu protein gp41